MVIKITDLHKSMGKQKVLENLNLEIPAQQITAFIGPNGAGKSTLLGVMARLLSADSGSVEVNGKNVHTSDSNEIARTLSILKQSNHIQLRLTVEELVAFGRYPYNQGNHTKADWEIIDRMIDYMGLNEFRYKFIDQLSGGQKQRAYIAMVLAQDTDYIFLDEPLNNLDMKHAVQIMKVLRDLVDNHNKTVVVVLHDINFAASYADYIVAIKDRTVPHQGTVAQIMNPQVLKELFDLDINIHKVDGQYIASYFTQSNIKFCNCE